MTWEHPLDKHYKVVAAKALLTKQGGRLPPQQLGRSQSACVASPEQSFSPASLQARAAAAAADITSQSLGPKRTGSEPLLVSTTRDQVEDSPQKQQVSKDLATLKKLFEKGLVDEHVYQQKQQEVRAFNAESTVFND